MKLRTPTLGALSVLLFAALASAQPFAPSTETEVLRRLAAARVPVEQLAEPLRVKVNEVLQHAPLFVRGPVEAFPCKPGVYDWMVENPDWTIHAWRAMGASQAMVEKLPDGALRGHDGNGGTVKCDLLLSDRGQRAWYVEGTGRPAPFLPALAVRAVVLLRFQDVKGDDGRVGIRHRAEVFVHYDSKAAGVLGKWAGLTAEAAATKAMEQVALFFSGMAWYASEHPDWAQNVLRARATTAGDKLVFESLRRELLAPAGPLKTAVR